MVTASVRRNTEADAEVQALTGVHSLSDGKQNIELYAQIRKTMHLRHRLG